MENQSIAEFSVDTSDLPDGISITEAQVSISGRWTGTVKSSSQDRTVVTVDSGGANGQVGVEIVFELNIVERTSTTPVTYTVTAAESGDITDTTFRVKKEQKPDDRNQTADDTGQTENAQAVVYIRVLDPEGNPIPPEEAEVGAKSRYRTWGGGPVVNGTIRVSAPPGTRTLFADADGYATGKLHDVTVEKGTREEPYDIKLRDGGTYKGVVRGTNGEPVQGATVPIEDTEGFVYLPKTDANGRYTITLASGSYSARVRKQGRGVSDEGDVFTISSPDDVVTNDFTIKTPSIISGSLRHINGTKPNMDAFNLQTETTGGLVWVEIGPSAAGDSQEEKYTPQDLSAFGVDETTTFEITVTVNNFEPDSLLWAARDIKWETEHTPDGNVNITVRTKPVHMEMIDGVHRGPTADASNVNWPSDDGADTSYEQVVQFGIIEMGGLPPDVRQALQGMSATTNAQTFGFPQIDDGELSIYLGAPSRQVDGDQHTGFYRVFLPDRLLKKWDIDNPKHDLQTMWKGNDTSFTVEEVDNGAYIKIDPITYSDGTMTVRSTTYSKSLLDRLPSIRSITYTAGQLWRDLRIRAALHLPL